jgi:acylphosphatase
LELGKTMVAQRFVVTGRVQGVGYRAFVEREAERIGVSGYVRNRRDGNVEALGIGTAEQLAELGAALRRGPMMARVDHVSEEPDGVDLKYARRFTIELTE